MAKKRKWSKISVRWRPTKTSYPQLWLCTRCWALRLECRELWRDTQYCSTARWHHLMTFIQFLIYNLKRSKWFLNIFTMKNLSLVSCAVSDWLLLIFTPCTQSRIKTTPRIKFSGLGIHRHALGVVWRHLVNIKDHVQYALFTPTQYVQLQRLDHKPWVSTSSYRSLFFSSYWQCSVKFFFGAKLNWFSSIGTGFVWFFSSFYLQ